MMRRFTTGFVLEKMGVPFESVMDSKDVEYSLTAQDAWNPDDCVVDIAQLADRYDIDMLFDVVGRGKGYGSTLRIVRRRQGL